MTLMEIKNLERLESAVSRLEGHYKRHNAENTVSRDALKMSFYALESSIKAIYVASRFEHCRDEYEKILVRLENLKYLIII